MDVNTINLSTEELLVLIHIVYEGLYTGDNIVSEDMLYTLEDIHNILLDAYEQL